MVTRSLAGIGLAAAAALGQAVPTESVPPPNPDAAAFVADTSAATRSDSVQPSSTPSDSGTSAPVVLPPVSDSTPPDARTGANEPRDLEGTGAGSTVVVRGQARHRRKEISERTLGREEIAKVAATAQDPLRALPTLPGVSVASDLSVRPVVRGGDLTETGVSLDGVPLLMPYHFGSIFSVFHQEALDDFRLYSGVAPASAEGALSGTVLARTRTPADDTAFGGVDVSLLRSSTWLNLPLLPDRVGFWLSGQTIWYDWTLKRIMDLGALVGLADKSTVHQFKNDVTLPTSWDVQSGLSVRATRDLRFDASGFVAGDEFEVRSSTTTCFDGSREVPCDQYPRSTDSTVCAVYAPTYRLVPCSRITNRKTILDPVASVDLIDWMGRIRGQWTPDPDLSLQAVAAIQSNRWGVQFPGNRDLVWDSTTSTYHVVRVGDSSVFDWKRSATDLQLSGRWRTGPSHETSAGFSLRDESEEIQASLYRPVAEMILGTTGNPLEFLGVYNQREKAYVDGPLSTVGLDQLMNTDFRYSHEGSEFRPAVWAEHIWDPDERTRVRTGLRLAGSTDGGISFPDPRLQVQRKWTDSDVLGLGAALHTQSDLPFEWRLSTVDGPLKPEKAWLGILEWEHSSPSGWKTTLSGWGKLYQDLASAREVAAGPMDTAKYFSAVDQWLAIHSVLSLLPDSLLNPRCSSTETPEACRERFELERATYLPESARNDLRDWSTPQRLAWESTGKGWATGLEGSISYHPSSNWTGWLSAEASVSRRQDFPGGIWYDFGLERSWKLSWVNAFRIDRTWEVSVRWDALAGSPYTPFKVWNLEGTQTTNSNGSDTTLWIGDRNSARLAAYRRLDLRISKESTIFRHPVTWYWEVWNALNEPNYVLRDANTGEFRWVTTNLPIPMIFLGIRSRF